MGVGWMEGETGEGGCEDANWERRSEGGGGVVGGGVEYCRMCFWRGESLEAVDSRICRHLIGRDTAARIADRAEARIGN